MVTEKSSYTDPDCYHHSSLIIFRLVSGVSSNGHETGVAKIQEQVLGMNTILIEKEHSREHS